MNERIKPEAFRQHFNPDGSAKRRYRNFIRADSACRVIRQNSGESMHVYRCAVCGSFHIGHPME